MRMCLFWAGCMIHRHWEMRQGLVLTSDYLSSLAPHPPPLPPQDVWNSFVLGNCITDKIFQGEHPPIYYFPCHRELVLLCISEDSLLEAWLDKGEGRSRCWEVLLCCGISLELIKSRLVLGGSGRNAEEGKKKERNYYKCQKIQGHASHPLRLQFLYLWETAT